MNEAFLPDFLAVATTVDDPARLTALTPRVMRWADGVWLMDLSACRSYWQAMAQRLRVQPLALLREVLERTLAGPPDSDQPLRATLADHPWPAALVLSAMTERKLTGFLQLETPFAQALYRDVVWSGWMAAADIAAGHFAARKTVPFNHANYRRQCRQLLATSRRLRLASPWELRSAAALSVQRRFGPTIAALWDWTFPASQTPGARTAALAAFPWQRWEWAEKPQVPRVLEFALWQWDAIAPLLMEDLDKLCTVRLTARGYEGKVSELAWRLTLNDLRELPVIVRFRHPHDLSREKGHHKTALLQAQYAFEAALKRHGRDEDSDIEVPIIAWNLALEACLSTPPVLQDLFGDAGDESSEQARLLELENKLPVALMHYGLCQDWLPESSYASEESADPVVKKTTAKDSWASQRTTPYEVPAPPPSPPSAAGTRPEPPSAATAALTFWDAADEFLGAGARREPQLSLVAAQHDYPWIMAARQRPLFIHAEPEPLDTAGHSSGRVFLERTSTKWWRAATDKAEHRDYYRLLDRGNRSSWVYQDGSGQWFVHGVFA